MLTLLSTRVELLELCEGFDSNYERSSSRSANRSQRRHGSAFPHYDLLSWNTFTVLSELLFLLRLLSCPRKCANLRRSAKPAVTDQSPISFLVQRRDTNLVLPAKRSPRLSLACVLHWTSHGRRPWETFLATMTSFAVVINAAQEWPRTKMRADWPNSSSAVSRPAIETWT